MSSEAKKKFIDFSGSEVPVKTQCELLGLARSTFYYKPASESRENLVLMRLLDEEYMRHPFYGYRRMTHVLKRQGYEVNDKRIRRLMKLMGIEAIYQKPNLSKSRQRTHQYPYLLRGVKIDRKNQVWSTDITYIPMRTGFIYLVAVMDWYTRYVLSWELSNSLEDTFCIDALEKALAAGSPEIFNSDQGAQFTGNRFLEVLKKREIKISWDGRGRALDNIFIERLWRSLKYENVYLNGYETVVEAIRGITNYLTYYNKDRPHQSLDYMTPFEMYYE